MELSSERRGKRGETVFYLLIFFCLLYHVYASSFPSLIFRFMLLNLFLFCFVHFSPFMSSIIYLILLWRLLLIWSFYVVYYLFDPFKISFYFVLLRLFLAPFKSSITYLILFHVIYRLPDSFYIICYLLDLLFY